MVERIFGVKLDEVDIKVGYIKSRRVGRLLHYLRYLFRHPLEDLWKGWVGYDAKGGKLNMPGGGHKRKVIEVGEGNLASFQAAEASLARC